MRGTRNSMMTVWSLEPSGGEERVEGGRQRHRPRAQRHAGEAHED
ncbi:hypothetical protein ACFSTC_37220 [Nonomuraea ferruginea]